jgi:hypothetical protein
VIEPSALRAAKADAPSNNSYDNGYTKIYSNSRAFAALKVDGSITAWGESWAGGTGAPSTGGYTKNYSTEYAFAAAIIKGCACASKT